MNSIDRPLLAGLLCGLLACVAFPGLVTSSAYADEDENEIRGRIPIELQERIELAIEEAKEELGRSPIEPPTLRESRDRPRVHLLLERQVHELGRMTKRPDHESQRREHEREAMEHEHMERAEREHREREHQLRREHEERERSEQDRTLDHEMRSLEIRRHHIELRVAEMELQERAERSQPRSKAQSDEVAFDAIKTAVLYMEPAAVIEFFTDTLDDVKSIHVKNRLRIRLAELHFKTDQPDQATKQLRMLIAP